MYMTAEKSIKSLIEDGALPPDRVLKYGIRMAEILHDEHLRNGMIADLRLDDFNVRPDDVVEWAGATGWNPAYGSPELLGLGRRPDERSDLYAFGAMLYEMLTGQLPIEPENGQSWKEAHLFLAPKPFSETLFDKAGLICRIAAKALEKSPKSRYQTAYGMLMDLRLIRDDPDPSEDELYRFDGRSRLNRPERVLGRQEELAELDRVFRSARTSRQSLALSGARGIGKSRLMQEWKRQSLREGGAFIALLSAKDVGEGQGLLEQAEEQWLRQRLCLLGPQALRIGETEESASPENLVLIVDDWEQAQPSVVDEAFGWLERLDPAGGGLLAILGSDAEAAARNALRDTDVPVSTLLLKPLEYEHALEWLSDTLRERSARVRVLAGALRQWSGGVPREMEERLERWHAEGCLSYRFDRHRWEWKEDLIANAPVTEEYKQAMDALLESLPGEITGILTAAALIGHRFSLRILNELAVGDGERLRSWTVFAQESGIVSPEEDGGDRYLFLSAYVRSKLYERVPREERSVWHCRIGEACDRLEGDESSETARRHLYLGADRLSGDRRRELAERLYAAGMLAMDRRGLAQATEDFEHALGLVWLEGREPDELACKIGYRLYNLLHYRGSVDRAAEGFAWIRRHAGKLSDEDRLAACLCQQDLFAVNEPVVALELSRETMAYFGWILPDRVSPLKALAETVRATLSARRNDASDDRIPENREFRFAAQCKILLGVIYPLSIADPALLLYAFARFVRHGLTQGRNEYFLIVLDSFEFLLQRGLPGIHRLWPKDLRTACSSGLRVQSAQQTRRLFMKGMLEQLERPEEAASVMARVLRQTKELHQVTFLNLTAITSLISTWSTARQLGETVGYLEQESEAMLDATTLRILGLANNYLRSCAEEEAWTRYTRPEDPEETGERPDNYDFVLRAEQAYLHGRYRETLRFTARAREMELSVDWVRNRRLRLFESLAQAALYAEGTKAERKAWAGAIRRRIKKMKDWQGPFGRGSSAYELIRAEWARANRENRAALQAYERAAACAKHEFPSVFRPLCMEKLALYYREKGMKAGSLIALLEAMTLYSAYGYEAKRNRLEREYPDVEASIRAFPSLREEDATEEPRLPRQPRRPKSQAAESGQREDESPAAFRAMRPEDLLAVACRIAGADRGLILSVEEGKPLRKLAYSGHANLAESGLAQGVLKAALATKRPVALGDAGASEFVADPHIAAGRAMSILSLPIGLPRIASPAVLYLENTRIPDVFSGRIVSDLEALVKNFAYVALFEQPSEAVWKVWTAGKEAGASEAGPSIKPAEPISALSDRETEVLRAIAAGHSNKEIAALLAITEATVKTHTHHLYGKLGVKRRGQAIAKAREMNLGG